MKTRAWIPSTILAAVFVVVCVGEVFARRPEDVFAGKVLILKKRPRSYYRKAGQFISFLRTHSTKVVYEQPEDRLWSFETMAFFRRPLGDYEVEMVFYDIENGRSKSKRRFVDSYPQYTQDRNTRILSGKVKLVRPQFDANRRYMLVAQHRGRELAQGEFSTKGTSQAAIDQQKRYEKVQADMEKSMKELEQKAKEQEEAEKKRKKKEMEETDLF